VGSRKIEMKGQEMLDIKEMDFRWEEWDGLEEC